MVGNHAFHEAAALIFAQHHLSQGPLHIVIHEPGRMVFRSTDGSAFLKLRPGSDKDLRNEIAVLKGLAGSAIHKQMKFADVLGHHEDPKMLWLMTAKLADRDEFAARIFRQSTDDQEIAVHSRRLGRQIAELHVLLQDQNAFADADLSRTSPFDSLEQYLRRFLQSAYTDQICHDLAKHGLERIHGDLHLRNVAFLGDKLGVLDLEHSCKGSIAYEVGALMANALLFQDHWSDAQQQLFVREFTRGYAGVAPRIFYECFAEVSTMLELTFRIHNRRSREGNAILTPAWRQAMASCVP